MNTKTSVITAGAVGTAVGVVSAIAGMYILSAIGNKRWRKQQSREENLGRFGRDYIDKGCIGKDYIDKDCDYNHSYFGCGCYDDNFKDGDNDLTDDDVAEIYKKYNLNKECGHDKKQNSAYVGDNSSGNIYYIGGGVNGDNDATGVDDATGDNDATGVDDD